MLVSLCESAPASAREIHSRVGTPAGLVYTTIAKVLDRLHAKGLVARERVGPAFVYRSKIGRVELERARAVDALSRLFGTSPLPAVTHLVEAVESMDPDLLDELARQVSRLRRCRGS